MVLYDNLSTGYRRLAQGFELVEGDITDEARLRPVLARVDAVMHFAAHAYVGESVENPPLPVPFTASPGKCQLPRRRCGGPVNPYGASKLFFENALEASSRAHGLRSVSLHYFNAAGADEGGEIGELHDPETHLIPLALAASSENGPELQVFGSNYPTPDGTCVRDYIHVSDLADAHVRALQHLETQQLEKSADEKGGDSLAINLTAEIPFSKSSGQRKTPLDAQSGERLCRGGRAYPPILVADPPKAQTVLGWTAKRNLADIVSSAWIWIQKNSNC